MNNKRYTALILIFMMLIVCGFYGYKDYHKYKNYKEDAIFLLDFLVENYPYFELKERVLNYKFLEHNEEFIDKIAASKNDLQFFQQVNETLCSLQNSHSSIGYFFDMKDESIKERLNYFKNLYDEEFYIPDIKWRYVEGKYVVCKSKNRSVPVGSIITSINGKKINNYILELKNKVYLKKDFRRNVFYSNEIYKYDNEPLEIEFLYNDEKNSSSINFFKRTEEFVKWYISEGNEDEPNVITDVMEDGQVAYLKVKSFDRTSLENGEDIIIGNFFNKNKNVKNIIIDIRGNSGGQESYGDFIISNLIDKPVKFKYYHCLRDTNYMEEKVYSNKAMGYLQKIELKEIPQNNYDLSGFKAVKLEETLEPNKNSIKYKGNLYILVDDEIYSSSENFINKVKEKNLARIIGTTTGGDGTGLSSVPEVLPNSKLVFSIPPAITFNEDGTVNEEIHTEPDIYIEQSLEDYNEFLKSGVLDISRSEYDTVYIKTLDMIKSNGN
ncbi:MULTISPECIES: S41 family peptidase [unclassified Clostridium]|uniref:S41 family peptidase n=1 Tax=unclassified Clostridium TaxID=2614128 RepID=UPI00321728D3